MLERRSCVTGANNKRVDQSVLLGLLEGALDHRLEVCAGIRDERPVEFCVRTLDGFHDPYAAPQDVLWEGRDSCASIEQALAEIKKIDVLLVLVALSFPMSQHDRILHVGFVKPSHQEPRKI